MIIGIISGFFNPLHAGHVRMMTDAKNACDKLVVIINNDEQQVLKKGKTIMDFKERAFIVNNIKWVDEVIISIDIDSTVRDTLEYLGTLYYNDKLIFFNGGDRNSIKNVPESEICKKYNIGMIFNCGGREKMNSSTNINKKLGLE